MTSGVCRSLKTLSVLGSSYQFKYCIIFVSSSGKIVVFYSLVLCQSHVVPGINASSLYILENDVWCVL